jgi:hypothetical protein
MLFGGITITQVEECIERVNPRYNGNLAGEWQVSPSARPSALNRAGTRWRGRIIVRDSYGLGARRSASGRHGRWACWHVFRDVIADILRAYPEAKITTGLATYTAANWEATYPDTAYGNHGSRMSPVAMVDLCECTDEEPGAPERSAKAAWAQTRRALKTYATDDTADRPRYGTTQYRTPDPAHVARVIAGRLPLEPGECASCQGPAEGDHLWCSRECRDVYVAIRDGALAVAVA